MPLTDYLTGLAFWVGTVGAVAVGTEWVLRRRASQTVGVTRLLAWALVFIAALITVHLVPAMMGILSRWAVLVTAVAWTLVARRMPWAPARGASRGPAPDAPSSRLSWLLAGGAASAVSVYLLSYLRDSATQPVRHIDALSFTLPGIVGWIREGTIWQIGVYIPGFPVGTYPQNGDVLFMSAMLPWNSDAFVRLLAWPLIAVLAIAVYCLARELGAPRSSAVLFAVAGLTIRVIMVPAVENVKPDVVMLASFMAGLAFLVRHVRTRDTLDLVLGGLGLGLAFGARWYGVLFGPAVLGVYAVGMRIGRERLGSIVRWTATCGGVMLAVGGVWLLRNWVETGNPLSPVKITLFGVTIFDAPPDPFRAKYGFSIAHYFGNWSVFAEYVLPDWRKAFDGPGVLALISVLLAPAGAFAARRQQGRFTREEGIVLGLTALALLLGVVYLFIPATAQGFEGRPFPGLIGGNARYAAPVLLVGLALGAWACGRFSRLRHALEVGAVIALVDGLSWSFEMPLGRVAAAAGAAAALAAAAVLTCQVLARLSGSTRRTALVVGSALLAAGAIVVGRIDQERFTKTRYVGIDKVTDRLLTGRTSAGQKVGIVGAWGPGWVPILAAFGPRFGNDVQYVGVLDRGLLRNYASRAGYGGALRRGRYDLLLVGRGLPPRPRVRWQRWARPLGYRDIASDSNFTLMEKLRAR